MSQSCSASPATLDSPFLARSACLAVLLAGMVPATGCGGSGGDDATPATASPCAAVVATAGTVIVTGTAQFVSVPNHPVTGALDYAAAAPKPIRGATAELLNAAGTSLASCVTNDSGAYAFRVAGATGEVRVRVRAEMRKTSAGDGQWDFSVRDNTRGDALYVLDSPAVTPALGGVTQRNVLADSGFDGTRYSGSRAAGPFAILDVVFDATKKVRSVSPQQVFPPLQLFWSVKNAPANGALADGAIGTSFYAFDPDKGHVLFLLGQEDVDTDEYDAHVVAHEWGHYFQHAFSRNDSLGGGHGPGEKIDMRVAFSEGWGTAWSGMALGSPIYADSGQAGQAGGFIIDMAQQPEANDQGWYSESSVQFLLFSFHQSANVGFTPIYKVMTGPLKTSPAFTAMHNFATLLKAAAPGGVATINTLLQGQQISQVNDVFGAAETNDGGIALALPIYQAATGPHCVTSAAGLGNKLGNASFIKFDTTAGSHTLSLASVAGQTGADPDFVVTASDGSQQFARSRSPDAETATMVLPAGTHTLALLDSKLAAGTRCFTFTVQ